MFNFIKKSGDKDADKEKRKRDKKERKEKQKRDRLSMSPEELLRLDEVRKSLKITRKRKDKEKLPSGITADYTADFLASLERVEAGHTQSDSSETSLNSVSQKNLPPLPPKPPKRGILKTPKIALSAVGGGGGGGGLPHAQDAEHHDANTLRNTLQNEVIAYQNVPAWHVGNGAAAVVGAVGNHHHHCQGLLAITTTSPSNDSLTDTTNSSFATPPFSLSPVGESQGFHRWSRTPNFDEIDLPLPAIVPLELPKPRVLTVARQKPPRNDFGFSLRRAMVLERDARHANQVTMKPVIFAEPGTMVQHSNETGLLPGDKLLEVNAVHVEEKSREDIIDLIKASGESVTLMVQPVAELSELSRRSAHDGLRRSGSRRFNQPTTAKTDEEIAKEKQWLDNELVWLMHRGGFTLCRRLKAHSTSSKIQIEVGPTGDTLTVDEDDLEITNPPQFDRAEDLTALQQLNETSILHTLRQRFSNNLIHTYAGANNLIVINPMKQLAIYSEKVVALFKGCKIEDMPPHIYSMAQAAYHSMLQSRKDQSIVFAGRSGAGKTTNFRLCLHYLVTCAGSLNKVLTLEKLTAIWNALESFGNCRTINNANATRFTQIFSVDFDQSGMVASGSVQVLMLERQRICKRQDGETTFHIVQRLLWGVEGKLKKDLFLDGLTGNESNALYNHLTRIEDRQRAQIEFGKVTHAFGVLGATEADVRALWHVIASIYHLGCAGAAKVGSSSKYQFAHPQCAQRAAYLLGVTVEELARSIFQTCTGSTMTLTPNGAGGARGAYRTPSPTDRSSLEVTGQDALEGFIVGLYSEAFNSVASIINKSISTSSHTVSSILLVDTPGFQNPATCGRQAGAGFDDLCHNYLQERLQLLMHHTNLVLPKDRYLQENVDVEAEECAINPTPMVSLLDKAAQNTVVKTSQTDLHEADRRGLLWLLDEEAIYPGASDESFLERLFTHFGDRDHQLLLRKAPGQNQFVLQHLQGTNPVLYSASGWLKQSRENPVSRHAVGLLQDSCTEEVSRLFVTARGLGGGTLAGSLVGIEGSQSLRRASSIRRTFTAGTAAIKRKSICLQTKFIIDGLIETIRRTKLRFIHCVLPQHNAGQCDATGAVLAIKGCPNGAGTSDEGLLNVPLLRSQIRGAQILDTIRLHKQGFPVFMPLGEFRRRFRLLCGDSAVKSGQLQVLDERKAVEEMLMTMDLDISGYRVGMSLIFFRGGVLSELEHQRDERMAGMVVSLQAHCRGYLARKRLAKRKLEDLAVRCLQRNVRKFLSVRDWPWWRLLVRVVPLLNVYRTEEELRLKSDELEALKAKLEKIEAERQHLKHENDKLESKLSEMTVDLAEEHSTATLAAERLDAETAERVRVERELSETAHKNKELTQQTERLEMELLYARSDLNGIDEEDEDGEGDGDGSGSGSGVYRQRYERTVRELEFTKRRLQQQHEDDLEQLVALKKQLEKKLTDAYEEIEEQRQVVGQWKRRVQKLNGEMSDLKHLLEEQSGRNNLLEKKQRRFDAETQLLQDELRQEKQGKERLGREKELLSAERFTVDSQLQDARMELEMKEERCATLQRELDELTYGGKTEEEVVLLRKQKLECERRLHDQEEELDEMAGQVQLLEQAKLKLEMSLEQVRKQSKKEAAAHDEELEEARCSAQKKAKALEAQLESEHEERTALLREKHELERRLVAAVENTHEKACDEALFLRLKRDLKRTKALLRDTQAQLERQKNESAGRSLIRQLRNQIDDLECARSLATKAKATLEAELCEAQNQLDDASKGRAEAEEKLNAQMRERNDLQMQLEENEEELAEVLKRYKASVQQTSLDQLALQEQVGLVAELEGERSRLREQLAEMASKLESVESLGDASSHVLVKRAELKVKELESKLELELTTKQRQEVQAARLREAVDKLQAEGASARAKEQAAQEQVRRLQRSVRELRDEHNVALGREGEALLRRKELEKRCEALEGEAGTARADLRLALKRVEDLQSAIQGELDDDSMDNSDSYSSDDSVHTFLSNHAGNAPLPLAPPAPGGGKLSSGGGSTDGYA